MGYWKRAVHGARRTGLCAEAVDRGLRCCASGRCFSKVKEIRERNHGDMAKLQKMDPHQLQQVSGERAPADRGAGAGTPGSEARLDGADESGGRYARETSAETGGDAAVFS